MNERCKHIEKDGFHTCGSYAFNLWKDGIDQGEYCDVHYWQDQAQKARADEREACAKVCDQKVDAEYVTGKVDHNEMGWTQACAIAIRARGQA